MTDTTATQQSAIQPVAAWELEQPNADFPALIERAFAAGSAD